MPRPTLALVAPALVVLVAGAASRPAAAQDPTGLVSTLTYSRRAAPAPVAGRPGATSVTVSLEGASGPLGIRRIAWAGGDGGPCRFVVAGGSASDRWDTCSGGSPAWEIQVDEGHLVGLQVCSDTPSAEGGPVRGVRAIWAARPDRRDVDRGSTTREGADPRCETWSAEARCAPGSAAPRIRLHQAEVAGRATVVGLELLCHTVDLQCWEVGPGPTEVMTAVESHRCRQEPVADDRWE